MGGGGGDDDEDEYDGFIYVVGINIKSKCIIRNNNTSAALKGSNYILL